jgi:hypothetical protein
MTKEWTSIDHFTYLIEERCRDGNDKEKEVFLVWNFLKKKRMKKSDKVGLI